MWKYMSNVELVFQRQFKYNASPSIIYYIFVIIIHNVRFADSAMSLRAIHAPNTPQVNDHNHKHHSLNKNMFISLLLSCLPIGCPTVDDVLG